MSISKWFSRYLCISVASCWKVWQASLVPNACITKSQGLCKATELESAVINLECWRVSNNCIDLYWLMKTVAAFWWPLVLPSIKEVMVWCVDLGLNMCEIETHSAAMVVWDLVQEQNGCSCELWNRNYISKTLQAKWHQDTLCLRLPVRPGRTWLV